MMEEDLRWIKYIVMKTQPKIQMFIIDAYQL